MSQDLRVTSTLTLTSRGRSLTLIRCWNPNRQGRPDSRQEFLSKPDTENHRSPSVKTQRLSSDRLWEKQL